jgi:hypothetical protein
MCVCIASISLHSNGGFLPITKAHVFIQPGQAAVLDLAPFSDATEYTQFAPELLHALHDDRVQTWTVSGAHTSLTRSFELTIWHKQGGLMSGALFMIVQHEHKKLQWTPEDGYGDGSECGSLRAGL